MKIKLFTTTILLILLLSFSTSNTLCLKKIMFKTEKICVEEIDLKYLFEKNNAKIIKSYFNLDKVKNTTITLKCKNKAIQIYKEDTTIAWYNSFLDIKYKDNYADTVYNKLFTFCANPDIDNRLFYFFKPGKIIGLNKKQKRLRIINFNTCANMSKFDKILSCIKKDYHYDKIFAVRCGVKKGLIKIK